jgi:thymidylate synthase (FAD)
VTEITFSSDITVKLIRSTAGDDTVVQAAQVSGKGENNPETVPYRLIKALMAGRHGSPFEHNSMTFFVEAPIFVFREWHRHRIASINEWSGRYSDMLPKFYVPNEERKMFNVGTKMKPVFVDRTEVPADPTIQLMPHYVVEDSIRFSAGVAWDAYQDMLHGGIANEVARIVLPVNTYSQMYWTVNARSLMNFLSLRVESDDSLVRSHPQKEIQMGADQIESIFAELMPATHQAFVENGRVAP